MEFVLEKQRLIDKNGEKTQIFEKTVHLPTLIN